MKNKHLKAIRRKYQTELQHHQPSRRAAEDRVTAESRATLQRKAERIARRLQATSESGTAPQRKAESVTRRVQATAESQAAPQRRMEIPLSTRVQVERSLFRFRVAERCRLWREAAERRYGPVGYVATGAFVKSPV